MSRKLRIEYPGAMYHVMNRGDQREDIFRDDGDRQRFRFTLGEACGKTEWQVHAYCLRRSHFLQWTRRQPNPFSFGTRLGRLDLLILPEGKRQGWRGEYPILGQWRKTSMVIAWYQWGARNSVPGCHPRPPRGHPEAIW